MIPQTPEYSNFSFPNAPEFPNSGEGVNVNPAEPNPISSALSRAQNNSIIYIPEGEYQDNVIINKKVSIIGQGNVIITSATAFDTFIIESSEVFMHNLQITAGKSQAASAINLKSGTIFLSHCNLQAVSVPCILSHDQSLIFLNECALISAESQCLRATGETKIDLVKCSLSSTKNNGILLADNSVLRMKDSFVTKCGDSGITAIDNSTFFLQSTQILQCSGNGIEITSTNQTTIRECAIAQNAMSGVIGSGQGNLVMYGVSVGDCNTGVSALNGYTIKMNVCQVINATQGALAVAAGKGHCDIVNCIMQGKCAAAISADSGEVTVVGTQISNITGTGCTAINGGILTISGSSLSTITECGIEVSNRSTLNVMQTTIASISSIGILMKDDSTAVLHTVVIEKCGSVGFHVINTKADIIIEQCVISGSEGNGFNIRSASPRFNQCKFIQNKFAGLEIKGEGTSPQFTSCEFSHNQIVGANVQDGATPVFSGCSFTENLGSGITVMSAKPTFTGCGFMKNGQIGICAIGGAFVNIDKSVISENGSFGIQVQHEGTAVSISESEVSNHRQSGCAIITDKCHLKFSRCSVHDNKSPQIDCMNSAVLHFEGSELMKSDGGIGITIHDMAYAEVFSSVIHDEKQAGVLIGNGGNAEVRGCEIRCCEVTGIYLLERSNGSFKQNKIHHNGVSGIHIMYGAPVVMDNIISDQQAYGIYIAPGAAPQISGNQFANNAQTNVYRA